jgi:hypothetical protein
MLVAPERPSRTLTYHVGLISMSLELLSGPIDDFVFLVLVWNSYVSAQFELYVVHTVGGSYDESP